MHEEISVSALFQTEDSSLALPYLQKYRYPWEILPHIRSLLTELITRLPREEFYEAAEGVFVARSARVAKNACLIGPTVICEDAEIRHNAYLRGACLVGRGAVVGNASELKNCILFDRAQAPHFNYIGDAVLGYRAHLGAGAVLSNLKGDRSEVTLRLPNGERLLTGLTKCGAFLADFAEVGCHAVINPGSILGRACRIYPTVSVRGFVPPGEIRKK